LISRSKSEIFHRDVWGFDRNPGRRKNGFAKAVNSFEDDLDNNVNIFFRARTESKVNPIKKANYSIFLIHI